MRRNLRANVRPANRLRKYTYPLAAVLLLGGAGFFYLNLSNNSRSEASSGVSNSQQIGLKYANGFPGGVSSNLLLWLKADTGWTSGNWTDVSGNVHPMSKIGNPQFVPDALNGNPGILFDGNDAFYVSLPEMRFDDGDHHITIITVYKPTNTHKNQGVLGAMYKKDENTIMINKEWFGTGNGGKMKYDDMFEDRPHMVSYIINEENNVADPDAPNNKKRSRVYINGALHDEDEYDENKDKSTDSDFYIGKGGDQGSSRFFEGYICEVIIFENSSGAISTTLSELQKIESYLAIKYGITPAHNVTTSGGVLVWDKTNWSGMHNSLAGIARDDATGLYRDTSMSWTSDEVLKVMAENVIDDQEYLVWGSNGKTSSSSATWAPPQGIVNYMHRNWRFAAYDGIGSDGVGTVSLEFDLTGMTVNEPNEIAVIVDSDDGEFSNAAVLPNLGTYNSSTKKMLFSGITINHGQWVTLGSKSGSNALPVELVDFKAFPESDQVYFRWSTAAEINNDYFTLERSVNMSEWRSILSVPGAGNSSELLQYSASDDDPLNGKSYYRLKQTDFNGEFSYSDIVNVNLSGVASEDVSASAIKLYPNPAKDFVNVELTGMDLRGCEISISNNGGQLIQRELLFSSVSFKRFELNTFKKGLYYITVSKGDEKYTAKLVVQ